MAPLAMLCQRYSCRQRVHVGELLALWAAQDPVTGGGAVGDDKGFMVGPPHGMPSVMPWQVLSDT